ncbi:SCP2 sterol-binding domain-containing protein [Promethearchaeum syntrophicum]|uniref:SCP2 sterol-binding domain-containing protein n=1 Tax=Promethearchaeum syntrophicum TaxID=2594042 RepID=A0A5B9DBX5_9ARCH|nr:SCP2 sterol-binding domain-containing protein [Candidatus Prometheoarchaeum syntrophicum]
METKPLDCGYSMTMNNETNQWECNMGKCGVISFENFLCENCCVNSSIMEIFNGFERLAKENLEFREELEELKTTFVQISLSNPDFTYWVEFGNCKFKVGWGEISNATIKIRCSQDVWSKILSGKAVSFIEFFKRNLKIEGDLQYGVLYLDLLELASEISQDKGVLNNE